MEGRYVSQSLGIGGTGGMCRDNSPSPALSDRSGLDMPPSPEPMVDDMSLPTLPRLFLNDDDLAALLESEVADVESWDPEAEVELPAVRLADDDEPRLKGLTLGKGTSLPEEPGRVCRAVEAEAG